MTHPNCDRVHTRPTDRPRPSPHRQHSTGRPLRDSPGAPPAAETELTRPRGVHAGSPRPPPPAAHRRAARARRLPAGEGTSAACDGAHLAPPRPRHWLSAAGLTPNLTLATRHRARRPPARGLTRAHRARPRADHARRPPAAAPAAGPTRPHIGPAANAHPAPPRPPRRRPHRLPVTGLTRLQGPRQRPPARAHPARCPPATELTALAGPTFTGHPPPGSPGRPTPTARRQAHRPPAGPRPAAPRLTRVPPRGRFGGGRPGVRSPGPVARW